MRFAKWKSSSAIVELKSLFLKYFWRRRRTRCSKDECWWDEAAAKNIQTCFIQTSNGHLLGRGWLVWFELLTHSSPTIPACSELLQAYRGTFSSQEPLLCFVLRQKKKQFAQCDRILLQCVSFCLPVFFFFSFSGSQTKDVVQVEGPRHPHPQIFGFYITHPFGKELIKSIWKGEAKLGM